MTSKNFPFKEIRPEQEEFFQIYDKNPNKKYVIAQLPTGSGKSGIAITKCLDEGKGYLITCSKLLQDQYEKDFFKQNVISLKGKENYMCARIPGFSCGTGPCTDNSAISKQIITECTRQHCCPYKNKVDAANDANIFLTNGSLLATAIHCKTPPMREKRKLLVFDEAHLLEKFLVDACKIEINKKMMDRKYKIFKYIKPEDKAWLESVKIESGIQTDKHLRYISIICDAINARFEELNTIKDTNEAISRRFLSKFISDYGKANKNNTVKTDINIIHDMLNTYMKNLDKEWVISYNTESDTLIYQPIKVDWVFKKIFDNLAEKFIFMSATIINFKIFCNTFGIAYNEALCIDVDCTFDPAKSPIHCLCNCKTAYKDLQDIKNLDMICTQIKSILSKHKGEKGIIHTGNMKVSNYIKQHIIDTRLLVREGDVTNNMIMEKHIKSKDTVLVSSSMIEGVDLKDDLSRFQIIVKLPWLSLGDPRIKVIADRNSLWYQTEMWRRLIQACGRSTRNINDSSHTYMLDSSFLWKLKSDMSYLPKYFMKRMRQK